MKSLFSAPFATTVRSEHHIKGNRLQRAKSRWYIKSSSIISRASSSSHLPECQEEKAARGGEADRNRTRQMRRCADIIRWISDNFAETRLSSVTRPQVFGPPLLTGYWRHMVFPWCARARERWGDAPAGKREG